MSAGKLGLHWLGAMPFPRKTTQGTHLGDQTFAEMKVQEWHTADCAAII
jgi:hypothetical protein